MGWSWDQWINTPRDVALRLLEKMREASDAQP